MQLNPVTQMIAYIIEHIAFYLRSVFLPEVAVGHRHVMLEEGVFRRLVRIRREAGRRIYEVEVLE